MTAATRRAALGAILASPLATMPAVAAGTSDLARACDGAVARAAWINATAPREMWSDQRLTDELNRIDDVLERVADEPAASLADLAAKARILECDWQAALDGQRLDPAERALLVILREVGACA